MHGYTSSSYGDGFADVYDDWYAEVTDVAATVERVLTTLDAAPTSEPRSPSTRVLELGIGTGRLAIPLAERGVTVVGIDSSAAMLARLDSRLDSWRRERDECIAVEAGQGDMATGLPDGPFDLALVAYNTLFNLVADGEQQTCFNEVARRLVPGGAFVVEAVVPDDTAQPGSDVSVRSMAVDRVVLSVSDHRPDQNLTSGQFVEFTEMGGVRLRPWSIRWASPSELDAMAIRSGLVVDGRFGDMSGTEFTEHSTQHVTVYRRPR